MYYTYIYMCVCVVKLTTTLVVTEDYMTMNPQPWECGGEIRTKDVPNASQTR
jgi:hypothetical protein